MRGLAALTVLFDHLRHFNLVPRKGGVGHLFQVFACGDVCVFLFFILSGFVMSYVYPSPVRWHHFFVARLARLVPVYQATLLVMVVMVVSGAERGKIDILNVLANFLMIQTWLPFSSRYSINDPAWSLSVEAFLYLFAFPLLVWSRNATWSRIGSVFFIVAGTIWGTELLNSYRPVLFYYWWLPLLTGIFGFGIGFSMHSLIGRGLQYPKIWTALGIGLIVFSLIYRIVSPNDASHAFLVLGLVMIVACSVDRLGAPYRFLARPFFLYLGDISYSLYLWHYPIIYALVHKQGPMEARLHSAAALLAFRITLCVATIALSLGVATLSYYQLEIPFRRLIRDRFVRPHAGAVGAGPAT